MAMIIKETKVMMQRSIKASPDGQHVYLYRKGEEYSVPEKLAATLLGMKAARVVEPLKHAPGKFEGPETALKPKAKKAPAKKVTGPSENK
jgi:hypothetical protein